MLEKTAEQQAMEEVLYFIRQKTISHYPQFQAKIEQLGTDYIKNYKNSMNQDLIEYAILYEQAIMVDLLMKKVKPSQEKIIFYLRKNFERNNSTLKAIINNIPDEYKTDIFNSIKDQTKTIKRRENHQTIQDYFGGMYDVSDNVIEYKISEATTPNNKIKSGQEKINESDVNRIRDHHNNSLDNEKKVTVIIKKKRKIIDPA